MGLDCLVSEDQLTNEWCVSQETGIWTLASGDGNSIVQIKYDMGLLQYVMVAPMTGAHLGPVWAEAVAKAEALANPVPANSKRRR